MPGVSNTIRISKDGQYVFATGIYKPRVKCFDVNNLSLKFERCFDSEVVTFEILSDDYSKVNLKIISLINLLIYVNFSLFSYIVIDILSSMQLMEGIFDCGYQNLVEI